MPRAASTNLSATAAAELVRGRELVASEYHEDLLRRYDSDLKFSYAMQKDFTSEAVRAELQQAESRRLKDKSAGPKAVFEGALASVPFVVSSSFDLKGRNTSAGNAALASGNTTADDAAVIAAVRAAGGVVFGAANTHELHLGATTRHPIHGTVKNVSDSPLICQLPSSAATAGTACMHCVACNCAHITRPSAHGLLSHCNSNTATRKACLHSRTHVPSS